MRLTRQREGAAARSPKFTAALPNLSSHSTQADGELHCDGEPDRLASLRLDLARHGLTIASLDGQELLLSGAGFASQAVPDLRCAVILLRRLNGGLAR